MKTISSKKKAIFAISIVTIIAVLVAFIYTFNKNAGNNTRKVLSNYDTHFQDFFTGEDNFSYKKYMYSNGFTDVHIIANEVDISQGVAQASYVGHYKDDLWVVGVFDVTIAVKCNIKGHEDSAVYEFNWDNIDQEPGRVELNGDGDEYTIYRDCLKQYDKIIKNINMDPYNTNITRGVDQYIYRNDDLKFFK